MHNINARMIRLPALCRLSGELELLYQNSVTDGGALEAEHRMQCQNYETVIKRMHQELLDARGQALKLSKIATEDRKKCISLQGDVQHAAAQYTELRTNAENARLGAIQEKNELEKKVKALTELNARLEERACHAEGEASCSIAENRANLGRWAVQRRSMGLKAVARIHLRHRFHGMKLGLLRWRQAAAFDRLRAEFISNEVMLQTHLQEEHNRKMLALQSGLEEIINAERIALARAVRSRDNLANERPGLISAARGYGPFSMIRQWKMAMLVSRNRNALNRIAAISEQYDTAEAELLRMRQAFAHMCVTQLMPRIQRAAVKHRFVQWCSQTRHFAQLTQRNAIKDVLKSAERMAENLDRIRRTAVNLVFVSAQNPFLFQ